jgi:hypothetical protein
MSTNATVLTEVPARSFILGRHDWVTTVDHKRLGAIYILYALVFLQFDSSGRCGARA